MQVRKRESERKTRVMSPCPPSPCHPIPLPPHSPAKDSRPPSPQLTIAAPAGSLGPTEHEHPIRTHFPPRTMTTSDWPCRSAVLTLFAFAGIGSAAPPSPELLTKPGLFKSLTEPPCSYCSTQNRKNFIRPDDRVVAWLRGDHNGGAIPLRHFLAAPRVIND